MTNFQLVLLVAGIARVAIWSLAVFVCCRIRSTIGIYSFGLLAMLAVVNTARSTGIVVRDGALGQLSDTLATPAAALVVLTLILNHREHP